MEMGMVAEQQALTLDRAHTDGFALAKLHTARFVDYAGGLDDDAVRTPVPGIDWTVGETVAHLASVYLRYTTDPRRADSPSGVGEQNAEDIARLGVDVPTALRTMTEQIGLLEAALRHVSPEQQFPFHAGQRVTLAGGWGNLLGELLAHGDDIARATGTTFAIPSADLEVLWRFTAPLLRGWLRPETAQAADSWLLRFPFGAIGVRFEAGDLLWGVDVGASPDYVLDIDDAAEFALSFPYRRRPIANPALARLAGRFLAL
jgi:uncharacterized protein (TIGR03083 family)